MGETETEKERLQQECNLEPNVSQKKAQSNYVGEIGV